MIGYSLFLLILNCVFLSFLILLLLKDVFKYMKKSFLKLSGKYKLFKKISEMLKLKHTSLE